MTFEQTRKITPPVLPEVKEVVEQVLSKFRIPTDAIRKKILNDTKIALVEYLRPVIDLTSFSEFYVTSGITDGLNHFFMKEFRNGISVHANDYEYLQYLGARSTKGTVYISNPSSIDGNFVDKDVWNDLLNSGSKIAIDGAYIGSTITKNISINENVETVFVGLSKMFGLYDKRVGFYFSRTKNPMLEGIVQNNLYFDSNSCYVTQELIKKFPLGYAQSRLVEAQLHVCKKYFLTPSDVCFIGTTTNPDYDFFKRGDTNRICLTEKYG